MRIPIIPRDRAFKKRLREELMKDNPYAVLDRLCYQDSLLYYGELEEEISEGRARRVKPRIRRRFARCKTTLIKIDYQARTIRITIKQGEYLTISWRSTRFEHRVKDWIVGEAIIFDDRVVIPFKALRRSMLGGLLDGIATSFHWMATSHQ
jgi:putative transposase